MRGCGAGEPGADIGLGDVGLMLSDAGIIVQNLLLSGKE
jgi:hypothetical protein